MTAGEHAAVAPPLRTWSAIVASSRGAAHAAGGLPNQDAVAWWAPSDAASGSVAVAVADGHGHPRHFRSDRGARLAVQVACSVVGDHLVALQGPAGGRATTSLLDELVVPELVDRWRDAVAADLARDPLHRRAVGTAEDPPAHAYGTTLLLAACTPGLVALAQIGDGAAVVLGEDGHAASPVPADPDLDGVRTTSLCQHDAVRRFRTAVVGAPGVAGVLLVTDGFANAQADDPWEPGVARDLVALLASHGPAWVADQLPAWTDRCASPAGSGDDTSAALAVARP